MQINYFGHIVSKEGIAMDPENIEEIISWPALKNISEVRLFMGLAS
jgi:hypothetical protein